MPRTVMHVFQVNNNRYTHSIDYNTDATHITDKNGVDVFTVCSSGYVTRGDDPKQIAKFRMFDSKHWMYDSTNFSDQPRVIKYEIEDLTKVELLVFKQLLEEMQNSTEASNV